MNAKILLDVFLQPWFLWLLVLTRGVLTLFLKIKGYFGEKSVAFILSTLD